MPCHLAVVDGDTVQLAGETIRLVSFDAPGTFRTECESVRVPGEAATERLRDLLNSASEARLSYRPNRDRYQGPLARLSHEGQDVADTMVGEARTTRFHLPERRV